MERPSAARLALGFAVAPLTVPVLHAALELGLPREGSAGYVASLAARAVDTIASRTTPLAYGVALVAGLPLVLALRAAGRLTAPRLVLTAAAAGAAVAATAVALLARSGIAFHAPGHRSPWVVVPAATALVAAVVAGAFCAVAGVPLSRRACDAPYLPTLRG